MDVEVPVSSMLTMQLATYPNPLTLSPWDRPWPSQPGCLYGPIAYFYIQCENRNIGNERRPNWARNRSH